MHQERSNSRMLYGINKAIRTKICFRCTTDILWSSTVVTVALTDRNPWILLGHRSHYSWWIDLQNTKHPDQFVKKWFIHGEIQDRYMDEASRDNNDACTRYTKQTLSIRRIERASLKPEQMFACFPRIKKKTPPQQLWRGILLRVWICQLSLIMTHS